MSQSDNRPENQRVETISGAREPLQVAFERLYNALGSDGAHAVCKFVLVLLEEHDKDDPNGK